MIIRFCQRLLLSTSQIMSKFNVVFVLGGPGAGKGTQCNKIVEKFGYVHLSAGELLRQEQAKGGEIGEMIAKHMTSGTIVPVEVTCGLLAKAMEESGKENFLVDGFPRNKNNLDGWNSTMTDKTDVKFVLFFDCPEEVCVQRCLSRGQTSGRTDDNEESMRKRIATYNNSTKGIINHYDDMGLVRKIDADRPENEVFEDVSKLFSS